MNPKEFSDHLKRFGPERVSQPGFRVSPSEAADYVRKLAASHYENFPVLGIFVPRTLRPHVASVYAFCRWADDLGDEVGNPAQSVALLAWWREELARLYSGEPRHPVMVALAPTVEMFRIPSSPFLDLISAFEQDQIQSRFDTFADLRDYCRRSADPVGRIVLYLLRSHTPERAELSDGICTGLQLANFCQDVSVDYFEKGRIYIPLSVRERHGVTEEDIRRRNLTPGFVEMMKEEVARAEEWLTKGLPLADELTGRARWMISLFGQGGMAILRRIRRSGYNVLTQRPKLTRMDRLETLGRVIFKRSPGKAAPAAKELADTSPR